MVPWKRLWTGRLPTNYDSGKEYRGVNILSLGIAEMVHGYSSPYWITFRQAQKHGGHIKRGEKATYIVFSDKKVREVEKEDGTKELKIYHFIKSFPVFNWDQTEGVPKKEAGVTLDPDRDLIEVCDAVLSKMPNPPAIGRAATLLTTHPGRIS
ncbi:MAG: ArdC family protein [Methanothrix sp.]|nr:ArdC family protein [Methanothrix sp.]